VILNNSDVNALRFSEAWQECCTHLLHARHALKSMEAHLPLDGQNLAHLDLESIQDIDQLVLRYSKLQDSMGSKLFPTLLKILMEPLEDSPMLDKLNRLEKIGILPSVQRWQELREIRNKFAHDYPEGDEMKAVVLNAACSGIEEMAEVLDRVGKAVGV
jgi:hypothetical protein